MTSSICEFRERILAEGRIRYRAMPWRFIDDAYGVLVSEVMLQQTQVPRVMERWDAWMRTFPTIDALAAADTARVLSAWQGLGYNRRALYLQRAAQACARDFAGEVPEGEDELRALPGIGPATAAGVTVFARNRPAVYLETNVRAVFLHEFFPNEVRVPDTRLVPLVREACPETDPRTWYYALLDCGAHLKSTLGSAANPSRRSAAYARQSAFEGSHRQVRAEVLRLALASAPVGEEELFCALAESRRTALRAQVSAAEFDTVLDELAVEGFLVRRDATIIV